MSARLRLEASQHRFVCCCDDCDHFVDDAGLHAADVGVGGADGGRCDLLFPTAPHRRSTWAQAVDGDELSFCKMFEARVAPAVPDAGAVVRPADDNDI